MRAQRIRLPEGGHLLHRLERDQVRSDFAESLVDQGEHGVESRQALHALPVQGLLAAALTATSRPESTRSVAWITWNSALPIMRTGLLTEPRRLRDQVPTPVRRTRSSASSETLTAEGHVCVGRRPRAPSVLFGATALIGLPFCRVRGLVEGALGTYQRSTESASPAGRSRLTLSPATCVGLNGGTA